MQIAVEPFISHLPLSDSTHSVPRWGARTILDCLPWITQRSLAPTEVEDGAFPSARTDAAPHPEALAAYAVALA